jgi:hypothetical protein
MSTTAISRIICLLGGRKMVLTQNDDPLAYQYDSFPQRIRRIVAHGTTTTTRGVCILQTSGNMMQRSWKQNGQARLVVVVGSS